MATVESLSPASMLDINVEKTDQNSLEVVTSTTDNPALEHSLQAVNSVDAIEQKPRNLGDNEQHEAGAEGNVTKRLESKVYANKIKKRKPRDYKITGDATR